MSNEIFQEADPGTLYRHPDVDAAIVITWEVWQ